MTDQELLTDLENLRKLSISRLVAIQRNFVEAIGNLDLSDKEKGQYRQHLEELDALVAKLAILSFDSRTVEFKDALSIKDATARIKDSAEQMEKAAKAVGTVESVFKIIEQGLKAGALFFGV
jgi:hypothetical protein